jgi:hypothetical protein
VDQPSSSLGLGGAEFGIRYVSEWRVCALDEERELEEDAEELEADDEELEEEEEEEGRSERLSGTAVLRTARDRGW